MTLKLGELPISPADQRCCAKRGRAATPIRLQLAGATDMLLLFDFANLSEFSAAAQARLNEDAAVRRYETSFVKQELKFAPFVWLESHDWAG
ncbi:MAG TPA: hypothetical protein VEZ48_01020 [Sphingomonadaceae bacterium]|jgi:hypothetical protein|nr:hypothetical protein [Sphingomonadaceae bacterium]